MSFLHGRVIPATLPRTRLAVLTGGVTASLVFVLASGALAAQPPVNLGTAGTFAVLAGSGITNTGPTTITGDRGTFPTTTETGTGSITQSGTDHAGDGVTQGAKASLLTAYNDAAGRTPVTNVPVELGGSTLHAGVYRSPTFGLTGTLTLDGQGNASSQFIFKASSTITTASNSRILLVNGAQACHIVWQIGSSATFNTGTRFVGDVLAHTSITAETGATFQGRLLASTGAVTLDTNTITASTCAAPTTSTTTALTVSPTASSAAGTPITLTAKVTPTAGTAVGTVTFKDGSAVLGSRALSGGSATFTLMAPTPGPHEFSASYTAGAGFTSSSTATATGHTVTARSAVATGNATTPTPVPTALTTSGPQLPYTGSPTAILVALALGLMSVGALAAGFARKRDA
jgi:hypothetical protein